MPAERKQASFLEFINEWDILKTSKKFFYPLMPGGNKKVTHT